MMLKNDLIHQIMTLIDHCLQEKKQSYWIHKRQTRKKDYDRSCCT